MSLYSGTYDVAVVTGLPAFDYFFTLVIVWIPAVVSIHLIVKLLARS